MELNRQMEQWQKTYFLVKECTDGQQRPSPSLMSTKKYNAKVDQCTESIRDEERPLSYQEFRQLRSTIERNLMPEH